MSARNSDLAESIGHIGTAFETFQQKNTVALQGIQTSQLELQERIEELEARQSSPGRTLANTDTATEREHMKRFTAWIKKPNDQHTINELSEFEHRERKDVVIGTPASGGYAVPTVIASQVEKLELEFSPVRRIVRVERVSTPNFKFLVSERGATSGWVDETSGRTATVSPSLREIAPTFGELYAYPTASEWALDDIQFNVGDWLAEEIADGFSVAEGEAVIRGDGSNKPTGMLNDPPTNRDDWDSPLRDKDEYQFVDDGDSPHALTADVLISLLYKVNSRYRSRGVWAMNSATAAEVRKLKLSDKYLWADSLAAGQPSTLLGYPVELWEQMDDIATNGGGDKFPIAFGDFRRAYLLADRTDLRILANPYSVPGKVSFYVRRRVGGHPLVNDAVKFLKSSA